MQENILNPDLLWIGSRCYRINSNNNNRNNDKVKISYEEEDFECEYDDILEIENIENGKYQIKLSVPQQFHGSLIGTKGATKKRIEQGEKSINQFLI